MKFKLLLNAIFFGLLISSTFAQQRTMTGKVTSGENGDPMIGVTVLIKGTSIGAVTDIDGSYQIAVPGGDVVLVFSYLGVKTEEIKVGNRSIIDVQLTSDIADLAEVVVTAFGVEQDKRPIGYSMETIGRKAFVHRQEPDIARLIRGRVSGVAINQTSGLVGSGTNIIIRGYSTITGNNQPLFVVDGIPFSAEANSGNQDFTTGSASASSRFLDLDPNMIEDVTVLKGLAGTVLWGDIGRNGVVLITTKNGKAGRDAGRKVEVSFTQGIYQSEIANLPEYQNNYGNGFYSEYATFFSNWGPAFSDLNPASYGTTDYNPGFFRGVEDGKVLIKHPYDKVVYHDHIPQFIDSNYIYQPYPSVEDFFQKGLSYNSSLSLQSRLSENASLSASYSYLSEEGFTPRLDQLRGGGRSNYLDKHNLGIGAQTKLENGLTFRGTLNFVNSDRLTPVTAADIGGAGNGLFGAILFTPRSVDLMGLPYQSPVDGRNLYYNPTIQNPHWTLNNSGQSEKVQRFFSGAEVSYDLTDHINIFYRLTLDHYSQENIRHINRGGQQVNEGELRTFNILSRNTNQLFNATYDFNLGPKFTLDGFSGVNFYNGFREENHNLGTDQFIYNLNVQQNFIKHEGFTGIIERKDFGLYSSNTVGYHDYLFLNFQGRVDWTSTLENEKIPVFSPSVSLSYLPIESLSFLDYNDFLNYLKLRVNLGTSAGYPEPYSTRNILNAATNQYVSENGTIINTNSVSDFIGNKNLRHELLVEYEGGLEARFWDNRIVLDLTLYHKSSRDLIINLPLGPSTGATLTSLNTAKVENKGVELELGISAPMPGAWKWDTHWNFTRNLSRVNSLYPGIERIAVAGYHNFGNYAIPGHPLNVIYGQDLKKVEDPNSTYDGMYIVDENGLYQFSSDFGIIGDPNPDFIINWINDVSWKGLSFGFHWQYVKGGDIYSSTVQALMARGITIDTDVDRFIPMVMPNAVKQTGIDDNGKSVYAPNDFQIYMGTGFFNAYYYADKGGIFDASVLRLRQVSLTYTVPQKILGKTPFGLIALTLSGENLWYRAPHFPEGIHFDPDISSLAVGNGMGFDFRTAPTAKKYGIALTATF